MNFADFRPQTAILRRHNNEVALDAFKLLIGWTILGWAISFVWALTAVKRGKT